jgi:MFS family permease
VQAVYLGLLLLNTLAASLIWGINTLFLLDAGLSNVQAFAANAFFTAGLLVSEIPTGVIADTRGRRVSYLFGTATLVASTLLYLWMWQTAAPFWAWALSSMFIGLGFAFFSGAVEAWLVDALAASGFKGRLESVLAKGEIVEGVAMLAGSIAGGVIAQMTSLGVPYVVRALLLIVTFVLAFFLMRDLGFTPVGGKHPLREVKEVLRSSLEHGLGNPPVRWVLLASPFTMGVSVYAFYAMQPYLMALYGLRPRSSAARRSPAGCSHRMQGGCFTGGPRFFSHARLPARRASCSSACCRASGPQFRCWFSGDWLSRLWSRCVGPMSTS